VISLNQSKTLPSSKVPLFNSIRFDKISREVNFVSFKETDPMKTNTVFNILLRDSPSDWISVAVWGTKQCADELLERISIGTCRNEIFRFFKEEILTFSLIKNV
jgi:hypothetical protein